MGKKRRQAVGHEVPVITVSQQGMMKELIKRRRRAARWKAAAKRYRERLEAVRRCGQIDYTLTLRELALEADQGFEVQEKADD